MTNASIAFDHPGQWGNSFVMHKVVRKRIRHNKDGVNIAADIDAVIAINTGADARSSHATAHSSHVVVQSTTARRAKPETPAPDSDDPPKEHT